MSWEKWSEKDDAILCENYPAMGSHVVTLLPNRTAKSCVKRARQLGLSSVSKGRKKEPDWTDEELAILREKYNQLGDDIVSVLPLHSAASCARKVHELNREVRNPNRWTRSEDALIRESFPSLGSEVFVKLSGRSRKECQQRAIKLGCKYSPSAPWTEDETSIVADMYKQYGISVLEFLPNHTEEDCRQKAYSLSIECVDDEDSIGVPAPSKKGISSTGWLPEEIEIITRYYPTVGTAVYKMLPGRSKDACRVKAKELGVKYADISKPWSQEEVDILIAEYPRRGIGVADLLPGRTPSACEKKAQTLHLSCQASFTNNWGEYRGQHW